MYTSLIKLFFPRAPAHAVQAHEIPSVDNVLQGVCARRSQEMVQGQEKCGKCAGLQIRYMASHPHLQKYI